MANAANSLPQSLPLNWQMFRAGDRVAVAVSGGADSVALLRSLAVQAAERGLVLRAAHVHHGLRGAQADQDAEFVSQLAAQLGLPLDIARVDTAARVATTGESVEQAARELRYAFLRGLVAAGTVDAIATAHTLDDQAETVLLKLLRGAWTEGLGGISPVVAAEDKENAGLSTALRSGRDGRVVSEQSGRVERSGIIVRPMLQVRREQVEAYLHGLGQPWREDSSNQSAEFTRNRVRHELLPLLRTFNPSVEQQLSRMAEIARDEEQHWQREVERLLPTLLLPGRAVRGGGRSIDAFSGDRTATLDALRLLAMDAAVQRRVLRAAALRLGVRLDFNETAELMALLRGRAVRAHVGHALQVERTARELRLLLSAASHASTELQPVECAVPGETVAEHYGLRVVAQSTPHAGQDENSGTAAAGSLTLRVWRAGDRVRLRHTLSDARVKEVLQRMRLSPDEKSCWPVLVWAGKVVWLKGCELLGGEGVPKFEIYEVTPSAAEQ